MTTAALQKEATIDRTEVLVSADSHVTEDADLWYNALPAGMRDQALRPRRRTAEENATFHAGGWDPIARVKEMEEDGVSAEVLFPGAGASVFTIEDPALQEACVKVYNDWLAEFCSAAPGGAFSVSRWSRRTTQGPPSVSSNAARNWA